jgi:hypothetical protein
MKQLLAILCIPFVLCSCSDDNKESDTAPDITSKITITGYTRTDDFGTTLGDTDSTDWVTSETWPEPVASLMGSQADTMSYEDVGNNPGASNFTAYPNPARAQVMVKFTLSDVAMVKFILVDDALTVIRSAAGRYTAGTKTIGFTLPANLPGNRLYRMYYAVYNKSKNIMHKGHGDIMKVD